MTRIRFMAARFALGAALLLGMAPPLAAQALSPQQREEVVGIVRDALRSDPSILRDALMALQQAEQEDRSAGQRAAIAAHEELLLRDPADPVKGNPRGDVTIVEFFDVRCGYCKALHPTMEALLREDPQVRLVLKDLPILGPNSVLASRALLAAQRQGKYAALQDALMRLKGEPTEAALQAEAQRAGLDWPRLQRDMQDPALKARLQDHVALARALGIEGTPALVIGGRLVPGAVDLPTLRQLVAEARQAAKPG
ncbi:DsbA family protein [Roseomonas sp. E05]|uniref:DsbA family protein n=1 Tax=Roseomonas sp. E05 TaxID=3046310 RepID=UPI0024B8B068|nr:DsbA family protein [Roseomonas sp. E05]MDJ0386595.1 DsbA family protein [Roseomonas sp. E05]